MTRSIQLKIGERGLVAAAVAAISWLGGPAAAATEPAAGAAGDFRQYCAPCHGTGGAGDGPLAAELAVSPADLTGIAARAGGEFPETTVYETIEGLSMPEAHGSRDMPVWGDVFVGQAVGDSTSLSEARAAAANAEVRIRALVEYLRSIQR